MLLNPLIHFRDLALRPVAAILEQVLCDQLCGDQILRRPRFFAHQVVIFRLNLLRGAGSVFGRGQRIGIVLDVVVRRIRILGNSSFIPGADIRVSTAQPRICKGSGLFDIPRRRVLRPQSIRASALSATGGLSGTVRPLWTALSHKGIPVRHGRVIVALTVGRQRLQLLKRVFGVAAHLLGNGIRTVAVVLHNVNVRLALACVPSGVCVFRIELHSCDRLKAVFTVNLRQRFPVAIQLVTPRA